MRYYGGKDYPWLCSECQHAVDDALQLFVDGLMPDTDDEEAPCMYAYDAGWLHSSKNQKCDEGE